MDYEKLYKTCYMQVYSYVMSLCGDCHLSEEITQNTFFKAMTASGKAKFKSHSKELTWLCSIARHCFYDEQRKQKRFGEMPEDMASNLDFVQQTEDKDTAYHIHQILQQLPEPYKSVFEYRVFGEFSFAQIGELFHKSDNWARVTYHRARQKIKERIEAS